MNDLVSWELIASGAGAITVVIALTQIFKNIKVWDKIPTQLSSYIIAVVVMELATVFTKSEFPSDYVLALFNAAIVSLSSNGAYIAYKRGVEIAKTNIANR